MGHLRMKKTIYAAAVSAVLGMSGSALAADLFAGGMKDASYEPVTSWTGFYAGVSGGIGLSSPQFNGSYYDCGYYGGGCSAQDVGGLIGGTLGYNKQFGHLVLGVEGDISWTGLNAKANGYDSSFMQSDIDAIATLRVRAGYAFGSSLFYATGGVALADANQKAVWYNEPCSSADSACASGWEPGFTVGVGYEAMLTDKLSFKAEYLYMGMPTKTLTQDSDYGNEISDNIQIARVGLNYKLTGGDYVPLK